LEIAKSITLCTELLLLTKGIYFKVQVRSRAIVQDNTKQIRTKAEALTLNKRVERAVAAALMLALLVNVRNMIWLNERVDKEV
jgi:hypothetical protein